MAGSTRTEVEGPRRFRPGSVEKALTLVLLLVSGMLVIPPLAMMVITSLMPDALLTGHDAWSLDAYRSLLQPTAGRVLRDTALFTVGSVTGSILLGIAMAWLVARTDAPLRALVYASAFLQFALPGMLEAVGWVILLGRGSGLLNELLDRWFGVGPVAIQSLGGMVFVQTLSWAPLVFLLLVGPLRSFDTSLEEAAVVAGLSRRRALWRITLPLLLPTVLSIGLLVVIRALQSFEVPLLLGTPAGVRVVTTEIYLSLRRAYLPDHAVASAYGTLLVLVLFLGLLGYQRLTRHAERFLTVGGRDQRAGVHPLGRGRWAAGAGILLVFACYLAPVLALVLRSFVPGYLTDGQASGLRPTWDAYRTLAAAPGLWAGLRNSLVLGITAATGALLLAALTGWLVARSPSRAHRALESLVSLPIVIPGTVLGLAFLVTALRAPIPLYGTLLLLVLAYVANFAPYALRFAHPALVQLGRSLEEAAMVAGARPWEVARRVVVPLVRPTLLGAWVFVFFHAFRDLSVAVMLTTGRVPVVATQLLDLWNDGRTGVLAAYGTLITLVSTIVGAAVMLRLQRPWVGRSQLPDDAAPAPPGPR